MPKKIWDRPFMSKIDQYLKRTNVKLSIPSASPSPRTNPTKRAAGRMCVSKFSLSTLWFQHCCREASEVCVQILPETFQREALYLLMGGCTSGMWTEAMLVFNVANGTVMEV